MMNLEMMTWASRVGGNDKYRDIAVTHANTTMANHFRPDFSSSHVVNYNQQDGSVLQMKTAQGDSDSSRSEEHPSELQTLMRHSYAVFCLKQKKSPKY